MSKKIKIPASIEEATASLGGLGALLQAKEWERAAIVYAFTRPDGQGERRTSPDMGRSFTEFAALGITGLTKRDTVAEYRKAWQTVIDDGQAVAVKPGDAVVLPDRTWPPGFIDHKRGSHATKSEVIEGFRKMVEEDPTGTIKEVIQDNPKAMTGLAKGVRTAHPGLAAMAATPDREEEEARVVAPREPYTADYSKDIRTAASALQRVLSALRRGQYELDFMERTLLALLGPAITEAASGRQPDDIFDEIESFLKQETPQ